MWPTATEPVKNQPAVILSPLAALRVNCAKDPSSFLCFSGLRTTAEILRYAQDDTFRISSHVHSRGITAHREQAEPRSGARRSAITKTVLSPLPGLFRRVGFFRTAVAVGRIPAPAAAGSGTRSSLFLRPWPQGDEGSPHTKRPIPIGSCICRRLDVCCVAPSESEMEIPNIYPKVLLSSAAFPKTVFDQGLLRSQEDFTLPKNYASSVTGRAIAALVLILSLVLLLPACGGGGGGGGSTPPPSNPVPSITSLSPATIDVGASATTVTINGTGFVESSTAEWNGTSLTTTYVSATELQVTLPATDLAAVGTGKIVVVNPSPGGGTCAAGV